MRGQVSLGGPSEGGHEGVPQRPQGLGVIRMYRASHIFTATMIDRRVGIPHLGQKAIAGSAVGVDGASSSHDFFEQAKCSCQFWVRGLKSGTVSPVSGSSAWVRSPLNSLQERHASHRFSRVVLPPAARGMMWSTVNGTPVSASSERQYPHREPASSLSWRRNREEICGRVTRSQDVVLPREAGYVRGSATRRRHGPCAA